MRNSLTRREFQRAMLAMAAAASARPAFAEAGNKVSIVLPSATLLPYHGFIFLGIPAGFYQQLGVQAEYLTINGSAAALQLVASGTAQFAHMGLAALVAAKKSQPTLPVRAVFLQDLTPIYSIGIPEASELKGPADLKGKRIGVLNLASGAVPWMKAYLAEVGVADGSYEILSIGSGAQAYAIMKAGRVDAICFSTGLSAALEILGAKLKYHTRAEPSGVIVANENFIKDNRDVAIKTLQGIILSQTFMEVNPEASVRYYWQLVGKPKGIAEADALRDGEIYIDRTAEMWKDYKDSKPWGLMSDATWTNLLEFKPFAASFHSDADLKKFVSTLYTDELIDGANKVDLSIAINAAKAQPGAR